MPSVAAALKKWLDVPTNQLLVLIGLFLLVAAAVAPVDRKGDASEYILVTESLWFDGDLVYDEDVDLRRHAQHRPVELVDIPSGLTPMHGTDGEQRFGLHSFYYSALAVPFFAMFGYRGFYFLNAVLVALTIGAVYGYFARREGRGRALLFAAGSVFLSAAWSYVFFTQTETLYMALLSLFFYFWLTDRPFRAAAAGGIAFGAQLPLAAFALPFFFDIVRRRDARGVACCGAIVAGEMAPQVIYNVARLGTLMPMRAMGLADFHHFSVPVFLQTVFDPAMGVVWFYPVAVYCLLNTTFDARRVLTLAAALLLALTMNTVANIYAHQVGIRFGAYLLPAFLFLVDELDVSRVASRVGVVFMVVVGAGLAINPIGNSKNMSVLDDTFLPYRIARALPFYRENPEVFVTSSRELGPGRVYARHLFEDGWTVGGERAALLLRDVEPGTVTLLVRSWARSEAQRVRVRIPSSEHEARLEPRGARSIQVRLTPRDIVGYARWGVGYAVVEIDAESWTPAWSVEGTHDRRRLGVNLRMVRLGSQSLYDADYGTHSDQPR